MIALPVLADRVRGCTACTAARPSAFRVLGEGPEDAGVLLVGEAPGATEEREGRPFVGDAGAELDTWIAAAGVERSTLRITNALACRPTEPGARAGTLRNRSPRPAEAAACREHLLAQVEIVRPQVVVTIGAVALSSLAPDLTIAEVPVSGIMLAPTELSPLFGVLLFALYHPSAVLRWSKMAPQRAADSTIARARARRASSSVAPSNSEAPPSRWPSSRLRWNGPK